MRSGSTSNVTFWPSTSVRRPEASIAEICDEHVLRSTVRRDETEALGGIEEFYGTGLRHWEKLLRPFQCLDLRPVWWRFEGPAVLGGHAFCA